MRNCDGVGADKTSDLIVNGFGITNALRQENGQCWIISPCQTRVLSPNVQFQGSGTPLVDRFFARYSQMWRRIWIVPSYQEFDFNGLKICGKALVKH